MNKSEFVEAIAEEAQVSKTDAGRLLNSALNQITLALKKGEKVDLPGFGSFLVSHRNERAGRNPNTGAVINIAAATVPKFKPGKSLKDAVNVVVEG